VRASAINKYPLLLRRTSRKIKTASISKRMEIGWETKLYEKHYKRLEVVKQSYLLERVFWFLTQKTVGRGNTHNLFTNCREGGTCDKKRALRIIR
jgi:hypothetical protein